MMFSTSSDETHSPPVLMMSFRRSTRRRYPSSPRIPMSPVWRYPPSQSFFEPSASPLYPCVSQGERKTPSPPDTPSRGTSTDERRDGEKCVIRVDLGGRR